MGCASLERSHRIDGTLLTLLAEHAAAGRPCALATVVRTESPTSAHPGDKAVVTADGALVGWVGGSCSEPLVRREALMAMADGLPRLVRIRPDTVAAETRAPGELTVASTCPSGGTLDIFIDPQVPKPVLLVIGGSPAARTLVELGRVVGFRTILADPGADPDDHPAADRVLTQLDLGELRDNHDCWVVVATMGHYDEDAVAAALGLPEADIGLIASARRAAAVMQSLGARGIPASQLARVRAPAGERRAGTQEEIALHALAEVAAKRRERMEVGLAGQPANPPGFATDPVCGMTVDVAQSGHRFSHAGDSYVFCSAGCAERFSAEPQRFLPAPTS